MRKLIYIITAVLLLTFASGVSAGDCYKDADFNDCKVKAEQGVAEAQRLAYQWACSHPSFSKSKTHFFSDICWDS